MKKRVACDKRSRSRQALVMSGQVTEMVWDERWQLIGMWEEGNGKWEW